MRKSKTKKNTVEKGRFDKVLVTLTSVLLIIGVISVADASSAAAMRTFSDPYYFLKQHMLWAVVGSVGLVAAATINIEIWKKYSSHIFMVNLLLLLLVLVPGIGTKIYGARRWINIFGFGFQPSEAVKLSVSLYFAKLAARKFSYIHYILVMGILVALIMLQPDLGTTLVVIGTGTLQLLVAGFPLLYFLGFSSISAIIGLAFIIFSDYRKQRLLSFFAINDKNLEVSYHIKQILIALGSGGLLGVGIGQSRQKQLFLPETATDSVFAVLAEEMGFVGATIIILLLFSFVLRCYYIALKSQDDYSKILATGISTWFGLQVLLNLSSVVVLTPLTGVPLPFFSYGGTSLVMILVAVGIMLKISKEIKNE